MGLRSRPILRGVLLGAVGALVLIGVHEFRLGRVEAKLTAQLAADEAALNDSLETVERVEQFEQNKSKLEHIIKVVNELHGHDFRTLDFLNAVRNPLEGTLDIDTVRFRRGRLHIWVLSNDTAVVARYAERLLLEPGVSRIEIRPSEDSEASNEFVIYGDWEGTG